MISMRLAFCCWLIVLVASAAARAEPKLHSIVLLLDAPRDGGTAEIRRTLSGAFGVPFASKPEGNHWLLDRKDGDPGAPLCIAGEYFALISANDSYFGEVKQEELEKLDLRLVEIVKNNRAWVAIDWFPPDAGGDEEKAYQLIGKAIAALIEQDVIGLYTPATEEWVWMHDGVKAALLSDSPLAAFEHPNPPTRRIADDDPRLLAATKEAQERWPEFVEAFKTKKETESFAVKLKFTDADQVEHMWVQVESIDGKTIAGQLDNEPLLVKNVKYGERVELRLESVEDWFYTRGAEVHGGFSIKVFEEAESDPK